MKVTQIEHNQLIECKYEDEWSYRMNDEDDLTQGYQEEDNGDADCDDSFIH